MFTSPNLIPVGLIVPPKVNVPLFKSKIGLLYLPDPSLPALKLIFPLIFNVVSVDLIWVFCEDTADNVGDVVSPTLIDAALIVPEPDNIANALFAVVG